MLEISKQLANYSKSFKLTLKTNDIYFTFSRQDAHHPVQDEITAKKKKKKSPSQKKYDSERRKLLLLTKSDTTDSTKPSKENNTSEKVGLYFSLSFSPISSPSFSPLVLFTPFLLFILSCMSLPCYSPTFICPLSLFLFSLYCLPNFVIPYFLSLRFHSPNFSPIFPYLNSSFPSLPPKCLFLNFLSHDFHFHNFSPKNLFLNDIDFMFIPHQD